MPSTAPEPHRTPAPENAAEAAGAHRPWTVAVLGPGGVGGLLAALLSRAGHRVICLAGEATAKTLRENGIRVRSEPFGDFTAEVEADTVLREPVDLCVVAVKHTSLDEALERVPAAVLGPDALVLPFLNGVEHTGALRGRYGHDRVAAGVIRVESARVAPGVIEHGSPFADIDLAGGTARPLTEVAAVLEAAGLRARVAESETAILWAKLAFLAPFALLTTRYGTGAGPVRTEHREELLALIEETTAVGRAEGPRSTRPAAWRCSTRARPACGPRCSGTRRRAVHWSWTRSAEPCSARPSGTGSRYRRPRAWWPRWAPSERRGTRGGEPTPRQRRRHEEAGRGSASRLFGHASLPLGLLTWPDVTSNVLG